MFYHKPSCGPGPMPPEPHPPVPCYHDPYGHDCYHEHKGFPHPHLPVNGPLLASAFILNNYQPYLFDSTNVKYGPIINFSENVGTRVSQRPDASCINLNAKFDFVNAINKNVVMEEYLEKCIGQNAEAYVNGLPITKSKLTFRMYYSIFDDMGGVVDERAIDVSTFDMLIHYTDIRDFFLQSIKGVFVDNIPAYDYAGLYRLVINKIELWMETIDTPSKCEDGYNPYYQWTDNNQRIVLQHDTIEACPYDDTMLLGTCDVNTSFPFQANLTTRLRVTFTAFTSDLIVVNQTYGVWNAIYEPSEERMKRIEDQLVTMQESINILTNNVTLLQNDLSALTERLDTLATNVETHTTQIDSIWNAFTAHANANEERFNAIEARLAALEAIPLATHKYRQGDTYIRSQLTWINIGTLYQVKEEFVASGDIQTEIEAGYLIPLSVDGDVVVESLIARMNIVEQETASAVATVQGYDTTINQMQNTVNTCEADVNDLHTLVMTYDERISKAEEAEFYINREAFPATGVEDKMYIDLTGKETYVWKDTLSDYVIIDQQLDENSVIQSKI